MYIDTLFDVNFKLNTCIILFIYLSSEKLNH